MSVRQGNFEGQRPVDQTTLDDLLQRITNLHGKVEEPYTQAQEELAKLISQTFQRLGQQIESKASVLSDNLERCQEKLLQIRKNAQILDRVGGLIDIVQEQQYPEAVAEEIERLNSLQNRFAKIKVEHEDYNNQMQDCIRETVLQICCPFMNAIIDKLITAFQIDYSIPLESYVKNEAALGQIRSMIQ